VAIVSLWQASPRGSGHGVICEGSLTAEIVENAKESLVLRAYALSARSAVEQFTRFFSHR
jgi:hypothetical protein